MRLKVLTIIILALVLLVVGVVSAGEPVHRLSAGGRLVLEDGSFETYGFNAQVDSEGVVSGQGVFHVHGELRVNFEANCLEVEENVAWLGGIVTQTSDPVSVPVGMEFTWQLQDNGEGAAAEPDLQSFVFPNELLPGFGLGSDCHDKGPLFALGVFEWQKGNVQIW